MSDPTTAFPDISDESRELKPDERQRIASVIADQAARLVIKTERIKQLQHQLEEARRVLRAVRQDPSAKWIITLRLRNEIDAAIAAAKGEQG